ncbi:response regulator transcription factor [Rickettsia typhi]|uniref:Response regulator protein OmpR n=3 Tax=Rickettsia typhi TaxID=785 RepID=Q68WV2_RICTY|nr:response regulator transcription factor [Rickettsia typhi]AAU03890.1 response regulator protein OmpR [Rickettsia typhi str. Wilmington]AFE54272.1 response regulator protein OmpR [Rickettsia typhi str. TH1527]AFE55112.1 response regulator protein OmpR [Rickettsia typhi str. B9991CWPP]
MQPHILIVDDDSRILALLKQFLNKNNFLVSTANSVIEAKNLLKTSNYDLIILDVMLPEITGLDFATTIRDAGNTIPIVMLTALSEANERVKGLEAGASDYITKPFEPRELLLRINNLINNYNFKKATNIIKFGNNLYNCTTKEFTKNNQIVSLSSTEQKLLEILIKNSGKSTSRFELSKIMGGLSMRSIDVQITRIRSKIEDNPKEPKYLKTVRNDGYALYI